MRNVLKAVSSTHFYRFSVVALLSILTVFSLRQTNQINSLEKSNQTIETEMNTLQLKVDSVSSRLDTMETIHPWKYDKDFRKKMGKRLSNVISRSSYFNFIVWTPVDTSISKELREALSSYAGPVVKINSLKRYGSKSKHCHGNAADLELTHVLVEYLLTDEGQQWLSEHKLEFYIEGKPGSRKVKKYTVDPRTEDYVFFNTNATGDHIHIFRA